ncbi:succinate-semialdehyde dehydrogenase [Liquorilactobacillus sucicola DSM 21376 = JCM 15457]|uniref:NAD-dependent aldehyde dehydrogenase n=1 Tax=Liquorilactobacillus sucicola DSM 21376 = JCM 15457 TaxID=1423806 RepID=A0A023CWM1_9LACO|nr:aldehyde dehydrogenase family protein [Liquorilactobacillus sucicola]KRN06262.1 NAD-dependent aldehyde dehydrogenase [Liquorilactobacillus sucicola DSM 21376 = JCM 15457]GAJ26199.1 succinate-semialdehyde dehydrogenase [Liquorilactobacillus sucicola DSM 21376 = JCM 15457]
MGYTVVNPYNGEVLKKFTPQSNVEVAAALEEAEEFYQEQKKIAVKVRAAKLNHFGAVLLEHREELAREAALNMGKRLSEGRNEIDLCANLAVYYAEHAELLQPKPYSYGEGKTALLEYHSLGIIASVEPWNFPYSQVVRVLAPNYLIGNPVILKHAGIVAGCAELLDQLVQQAGWEKGAFKNLFISHEQVSQIIADKRVQGVALTGSEAAGRTIASAAGKSLIKSTMELGGSDVFAILDDADVKTAVMDATAARLRNAGQVCTSAKRFIVEKKIAAEFIAGIKQSFATQKMGDPLDETTELAPLSSHSAAVELQAQVDAAIENGAHVLVAGGIIEGEGNFFKPIVLTNVKPDNPAYRQEFFGPVAQVFIAEDDEQVIALANDSDFGLAGAVYSADKERAHRVASKIETGQVFINRPSGAHPELPFGGVKNSGYGREMSDLGLYEFTNQKIIVFK